MRNILAAVLAVLGLAAWSAAGIIAADPNRHADPAQTIVPKTAPAGAVAVEDRHDDTAALGAVAVALPRHSARPVVAGLRGDRAAFTRAPLVVAPKTSPPR